MFGDPAFEGSEAKYSAKLFLTLVDMKSARAKELEQRAGISYTTMTACMKRLSENGLIESKGLTKIEKLRLMESRGLTDEDKLNKGKDFRVMYMAPDNPSNRIRNWAEQRKASSDTLYQQSIDIVTQYLRKPEPVIIVETVVSSREPLMDTDYEQAITETITMLRKAESSIKIMTRDFSWINRALPEIKQLMATRPKVMVQLLVSWKELREEYQKSLLDLGSFGNLAIKELAIPEVFRLSIVDDLEAYLVKRHTNGKKVDVEGVVHVSDADFVKTILCAFFESRWMNPASKRVFPKR